MTCSNFKLNLPTDIPWERICVTEDMIDPVVCDERLPAKWQTSMAVFKYVPDDEYQSYPEYKISYLKVTATITGYQPLDKEIQGQIDWDGVDVSTINGLKDLLNSYNPCHGAILQVIVGPNKKDRENMKLKDYPFFMDFEPKKRELYELATDTKEKQSRSVESLNLTKSAGSTQSMEVLDVDMGGSFGFGMQGSYAGTGGGFNVSSSTQGQWGTKRLNSDQSMTTRSSDVGQEKRESYSFSTQISQMYHLLDSYHLATNRALFFIQPRPHTLEEPSGFVRGPRPVDGIQEFFMIVAQPRDQKDFCVSLRLDTSHLTKIPIMEYERKSKTSGVVSVSVPVPKFSENDLIANGFGPDGKVNLYRACFIDCWDVPYLKWTVEKSNSETVDAPSGFVIENYTDVRNEHDHGSSTVFISGDASSATITVKANGLIYEELGEAVCLDCPDWVDGYYGHATRQISLNCRSMERTKQVGETEVLLITTRGLCCCSSGVEKFNVDEFVVGFRPIPRELSVLDYLNKFTAESDLKVDSKQTIRLANEMSNYIKTETIKALNDPTVRLQKFWETDFFAKQLENKLVQTEKGRKILYRKDSGMFKDLLPKLQKHFGKETKGIQHRHLISLKSHDLARVTGIKADEAQKLKLGLMGVKFHPQKVEKK